MGGYRCDSVIALRHETPATKRATADSPTHTQHAREDERAELQIEAHRCNFRLGDNRFLQNKAARRIRILLKSGNWTITRKIADIDIQCSLTACQGHNLCRWNVFPMCTVNAGLLWDKADKSIFSQAREIRNAKIGCEHPNAKLNEVHLPPSKQQGKPGRYNNRR